MREPPSTQFEFCDKRDGSWVDSESVDPKMVGPWYKVMTIAPVIATTVPNDFAWLVISLKSNLSILQNHNIQEKNPLPIKEKSLKPQYEQEYHLIKIEVHIFFLLPENDCKNKGKTRHQIPNARRQSWRAVVDPSISKDLQQTNPAVNFIHLISRINLHSINSKFQKSYHL